MLDKIVVDVETAYLFEEVGGRNNLDKLDVSLGVVYSYIDDSYSFYKQSSIQDLRNRLLIADQIITFNGIKFDYPVIFKYKYDDWLTSDDYKKLLPKSNDLLRRIWISLGLSPLVFTGAHKGYSLGAISLATLGLDKADLGKEAPALMRRDEWDVVAGYCLHDVKLTKELAEFIDLHGYIVNSQDKVIRIWAKPEEVV